MLERERIISCISSTYRIPLADFVSERTGKPLAEARQVAMWLMRYRTPMSLPQIGKRLHRDHTTVMYGIARIAARIKSDRDLAARIGCIEFLLDARDEAPGQTSFALELHE